MQLRRLLITVAVLLAGCGSSGSTSASPGSSSAPSLNPVQTHLAASDVVAKLKAAGQPVGQVTVFDAATDSNSLLGRPHQYTGKASWVDTRLPAPSDPTSISAGGSVEVFASADDLHARATYVGTLAKQAIFSEYEYLSVSGLVFLRIAGALTPAQAQAYAAAAKAFLPDLAASTT